MGLACFQLNIFALNQQRSKVNRQLVSISDQREMISTRITQIISNQSKTNSVSWYTDPNVILLQSKDNDLDMQQKTIETQLKDIEAKLESFEKQRDENAKAVPKLA